MRRVVLIGLLLFFLYPAVSDAPAFAQTGDRPEAPVCAACGEPIAGEYISALEKCWHPEHFVCTHCGRPFADNAFYENGGRPYCENCYTEIFCPRCMVCGLPIRSTYVENSWGDIYCPHHENELPACFSCGRLVCDGLTGGGVRYDDGRVMCTLCRESAVDDFAEGKAILSGVRGTLRVLGLDLGSAKTPLGLVDLRELKEGGSRDLSGNTRTALWSQNGEVIERTVEEILILRGLPYEHFCSVAAHELGHAWLFLEGFPELPLRVEEGICELISYLWLQQMGTLGAEHRMRVMEHNDDPVYGHGFRAALKSYRQYPLDSILAYVREHRRFPTDG